VRLAPTRSSRCWVATLCESRRRREAVIGCRAWCRRSRTVTDRIPRPQSGTNCACADGACLRATSSRRPSTHPQYHVRTRYQTASAASGAAREV
jgi:hypothetical protein